MPLRAWVAVADLRLQKGGLHRAGLSLRKGPIPVLYKKKFGLQATGSQLGPWTLTLRGIKGFERDDLQKLRF